MLKIVVQPRKYWDSKREIFFTYPEKPVTLQLEHSLVSISKWESKWNKPFIANSKKDQRTDEEMRDYIRCMTLTQNVDQNIYMFIPDDIIREVTAYINAPMTATTFSNTKDNKPNREIVTSELVYYWMTAFGIPFTCEKWHFNRLMTLIKICGIKNGPEKKMSPNEIRAKNMALNKSRRKAMHTKG